jgi:hypothetical protein
VNRSLLVPVVVLGAVATFVMSGWGAVAVAASAGERIGDVSVRNGTDPQRALDAGGSLTPFVTDLPKGAACPGDSANDDYRVQTFIVPASDDPGSLSYESVKPAGDGRWAINNVFGTRLVHLATEMNSNAGTPGLIPELPQMNLSRISPGSLADGRYHLGVACTLGDATVRYWDTDLEITTDPVDQPGQIRWAVVGSMAPAAGSGFDWTRVALVLLGLALTTVVAIGISIRRHASRVDGSGPRDPSPELVKEKS